MMPSDFIKPPFLITDEMKTELKSMFRLDLKEELEEIAGRPLTKEEMGEKE